MTPPPISKDLWFAAALTTAALPSAMAQTSSPGQPLQAGVVTAVAAGSQFAGDNQVLHVGNNVQAGQRLRTGANGPLHILFLDQSALTLGPNSEITIDEFTYDPDTRQGQIRLALTTGSLRVVGGHISKNNATVVTTPHGKVEISGGIGIIDSTPNRTDTSFLFGQSMRLTDNNGNTNTITRPGFGVTMNTNGSNRPLARSPGELASTNAGFEGNSSGQRPGNNQNLPPGGGRPGGNAGNSPTGGAQPGGNGGERPPGADSGNPPPGGAQPLISTGLPSSRNLPPSQTLAGDRLTTTGDNNPGGPNTPLQNVLGSGQTTIQS